MISGLLLPFTLVVLTALYLSLRRSRVSQFMKQIGGPPQLPIIGNGLDFNVPTEELPKLFHSEWPRKYGPRYTFSVGPIPYFTSSKPSDVEKILSSTTEIEKSIEYSFFHNWLGDGLILSTGAKWFQRRKMITPSFHFKILEDFIPTFSRNSAILADLLRKDCMEGAAVVEISRYISLCTLDIICETAMGKPVHAQKKRDSEYVRAVIRERKLERESLAREDKKIFKSSANADEQDGIYMNKKQVTAFMDTLLEVQANNPGQLTDLDIREEVDTFMFAGHHTVSTSLAWTVLLLANNPDCQERVHEELDRIFGEDKSRPVTTAELVQLKYLEYCIKESLRLYPSVPALARHLKNDVKLDDEVTIPRGVNFSLVALPIHLNPEIFPDPYAFKPDRFLPENAAGRHAYAYIPFSAGQRNCIGQKFAMMEQKVVLAQMFRNFRVEAVDTLKDVVIMIEIVLRSKNGVRVKLHPR